MPAALLVALGALAATALLLGAIVLSGVLSGPADADPTDTASAAPTTTASSTPITTASAAPATTPAIGTAPSAVPSAGPGDLGLAQPISAPGCDGSYIVVVKSATTPASYVADVRTALAEHPGSQYLRTAGSCSSLAPVSSSGTTIYAVYLGPYISAADACAARNLAGGDSYVRRLDRTTPPGQDVAC